MRKIKGMVTEVWWLIIDDVERFSEAVKQLVD